MLCYLFFFSFLSFNISINVPIVCNSKDFFSGGRGVSMIFLSIGFAFLLIPETSESVCAIDIIEVAWAYTACYTFTSDKVMLGFKELFLFPHKGTTFILVAQVCGREY